MSDHEKDCAVLRHIPDSAYRGLNGALPTSVCDCNASSYPTCVTCRPSVKKREDRYDRALAALRLAEPALRTLRDGHCDCIDCQYTKALDAIVAVLKDAK